MYSYNIIDLLNQLWLVNDDILWYDLCKILFFLHKKVINYSEVIFKFSINKHWSSYLYPD